MSTRHIARTIALQTLFEIDMKEMSSLPKDDVHAIILRNTAEFGEGIKDTAFAENIVTSALSRKITLDDIITRAAPDWPLEKIGVVDRNVLRIGLAELLFGDRTEVPPKVAIDEAIELAKSFGGDTSGRFVNGVLGAIYKELGEPEKTQVTKTKQDYIESGKREILAGAVVYALHEHKVYFGLVHDVFGYWTLPKGHIEQEEDKEKAVIRELKKEIGAEGVVIRSLGENEYIANKPDQGKIVKQVFYFLVESPYQPLVLEKKGGLDETKWIVAEEALTLRMYSDIKPLIEESLKIIKENKASSAPHHKD